MPEASLQTIGTAEQTTVPAGLCTGQLVELTRDGRLLVDFPGNPGGLVEARYAGDSLSLDALHVADGLPVLLFFEHADHRLPIILGVLHKRWHAPNPAPVATPVPVVAPPPATATATGQNRREVVVDGQRVVVEAADELVLRCGKSSVTLRKDGKIVIQGTRLVSRATETNRITGGSVAIN